MVTGLTDGRMTEIVKVLGDDKLEEGTPVVVGKNWAGDGDTTNPLTPKLVVPKIKDDK